MRKAYIEVSIKGQSFKTEFPIKDHVEEYQIADEAFRLGIMFANTQVIAKYGHTISPYEFGKFIQDLDYTYEIKEVK